MLDIMSKVIEDIPDSKVSFADIREETISSTQIQFSNGDLRRFGRASRAGAIARALVGECWGMASTSETLSQAVCKALLADAIKSAKANARFSRKIIDLTAIEPIEKSIWQKCKLDPAKVSLEEKLDLVKNLDQAQKIDDKIVNTNAVYNDIKKTIHLVNTAGSRLEWDELRVLGAIQSVAREGAKMQYDYQTKGGRAGYELLKDTDPTEFGETSAKGAIELLLAEKPPSGTMTVITDGDISGLIAHEVCGHASEADEVVKKRSFLTGLVGVKVGSDMVTMIDDGTLDEVIGGYPFDSEGTPSSRTVIIENGVYTGYLHTLETASLMDVKPTGNGRAQDYNRRIFARMTNTFFDTGDWKNDEIIEDTKSGLYVVKFLSGMEDVVGGGVQCTALKGYIVKN